MGNAKTQDPLTSAAAVTRASAEPGPPPWNMVSGVVQDAAGFTKSWYCHPTADLFVWRDGQEAVASFQFCFDKGAQEKMVAWDRDKRLHMGLVDTGDSSPVANRSPMMVQGGSALQAQAREAWQRLREGLPAELQGVVERALG